MLVRHRLDSLENGLASSRVVELQLGVGEPAVLEPLSSCPVDHCRDDDPAGMLDVRLLGTRTSTDEAQDENHQGDDDDGGRAQGRPAHRVSAFGLLIFRHFRTKVMVVVLTSGGILSRID